MTAPLADELLAMAEQVRNRADLSGMSAAECRLYAARIALVSVHLRPQEETMNALVEEAAEEAMLQYTEAAILRRQAAAEARRRGFAVVRIHGEPMP